MHKIVCHYDTMMRPYSTLLCKEKCLLNKDSTASKLSSELTFQNVSNSAPQRAEQNLIRNIATQINVKKGTRI